VGSFEQFAIDYTQGKWKKHEKEGLRSGEKGEMQGEFIEEFQIKQLIQ
jgi:hypothetical protein